jgi:hypothetical protein
MAGALIDIGSGNTLSGDTAGFTKVVTAQASEPSSVGAIRSFQENDDGVALGADPQLLSIEADLDYRARIATDTMLEDTIFNYTAQNTGKTIYRNTTMTNSWTSQGVVTNAGNITTTTTGTLLQSYAYFPCMGTATLSGDFQIAFSHWPVSNDIKEYGFGLPAAANPYAPTDGVYIRVSSSGASAVCNFNGIETVAPFAAFTPTLNKKYQFIIYIHHRVAEFWINDAGTVGLYAVIDTPAGNGQPNASSSLPWFFRHVIAGGAASVASNMTVSNISVRVGGQTYTRSLGEFGNAVYGSYQGLDGGTMGSLANYANSANPTAAVPTNTTSAVCTGLGGQGWETDTLAVTTDGIIMSYQVPSGTATVPGRRLKITRVKIDGYIQTALTGGGYNAQFSLAFGSTNVSLATAEAAAAKAPRRLALGSHSVASAAAALTQLATITADFTGGEIYVNPGEFVQIVKKKVGTAPSAGVIAWTFTIVYAWE